MTTGEKELTQLLSEAIRDGDEEKSREFSNEAIQRGFHISNVFNMGVLETIKRIGDEFGRGNVFLTELVMATEAAKNAMAILLPEMLKQKVEIPRMGKVLIGTVAGDIHDLGKNLVAAILRANGFEVIDLGIDVATNTFIEKVKELKPDILGLSAMVTTTMPEQKKIIDALEEADLREKIKVIIGGASIDAAWTERIGADALGLDLSDALKKCKKLVL